MASQLPNNHQQPIYKHPQIPWAVSFTTRKIWFAARLEIIDEMAGHSRGIPIARERGKKKEHCKVWQCLGHLSHTPAGKIEEEKARD